MKKLLFIVIALIGAMSGNAQIGVFNHLGIGVGVGTTGITIEAATPITHFLALRGGVNIMPQIKMNTDLNIESNVNTYMNQYGQYVEGANIPHYPSKIDVEGKLNMTSGRVLLDFYPIPNKGLFICGGIYFGGNEVIKAYNKQDGVLKEVVEWNKNNPNEQIGATLGDYFLTPDDNGNVNAHIEVAKVRPYVGLGFGRSIPKHLLGFQFELGCQFWGTPKVYCDDILLEKDKVGDDDGGVMKTISKVTVYPTLTFRLTGKIF